MAFYGELNALRFDADVALRCRCATMLEQPLHKSNVVPVIFINLGREPFSEAVSANTLIAQIIAYYIVPSASFDFAPIFLIEQLLLILLEPHQHKVSNLIAFSQINAR